MSSATRWALAVVTVILAASARKGYQSGLILESQGKVSDLTVGTIAVKTPALIWNKTTGALQSRDGLYVASIGRSGEIESITTRDSGVFTERLIRPQYSSLRDVLKAYGQNSSVRSDSSTLFLDYPGITFEFTPSRTKEKKDFFGSRVQAITVKRPPDAQAVK